MSEKFRPSPENLSGKEAGFHEFEWYEPCHHPNDSSTGKSWISSDIGSENIPKLLLKIADILCKSGYTKLESKTPSHTHSKNMKISIEKVGNNESPRIVFTNKAGNKKTVVDFEKETGKDGKEDVILMANGEEINPSEASEHMQLYNLEASLESAYYSLGFENKVQENKGFLNHSRLREKLILELGQKETKTNGSDQSS